MKATNMKILLFQSNLQNLNLIKSEKKEDAEKNIVLIQSVSTKRRILYFNNSLKY